MTTAYDYSGGAIPPRDLLNAGVRTVMRYVSTPGNAKNITPAEYRALTEAGITVGLVYETTADWMTGGYNAGLGAARSARQQATAVGYPPWHRIWYACDFAAAASQLATILDCLHGCADAEGSASYVAVYGDYDVCNAAAAFDAPWQTDAWSSGRWCGAAVLRQTGAQAYCGGVQVDVNELAGMLFPAATKPALPPTPAQAPQLEEDINMLIIDAPRSAAPNATRDMWLLGNGKYQHIVNPKSYQGYVNAGLKVAVIEYEDHAANLTLYGVAGIAA